jgi:sec-independent protein translocase protein TatB
MFGVDTTEFLIVAIAALLFIGPKDLPMAMRTVGRWVAKVRGMARHFTSGIETMMREAELEEMETKWREENERIMREYPSLEQRMKTEEPAPADSAAAEDEPPLPLEAPAQLPPGKRELP